MKLLLDGTVRFTAREATIIRNHSIENPSPEFERLVRKTARLVVKHVKGEVKGK